MPYGFILRIVVFEPCELPILSVSHMSADFSFNMVGVGKERRKKNGPW